jgi:hypothetical protein
MISQPPMYAQVVEVHNKMDLVEAASADDGLEGAGTGDDAAEDAADVPGSRAAADSQDAPTSSWPAPHLQQHGSASSLSHQPPQPAAAANGQQQAAQPSRVHVSAVTGAGLGLLLQEIDRKVCLSGCTPHHAPLSSRVCAHVPTHQGGMAAGCCAPVGF